MFTELLPCKALIKSVTIYTFEKVLWAWFAWFNIFLLTTESTLARLFINFGLADLIQKTAYLLVAYIWKRNPRFQRRCTEARLCNLRRVNLVPFYPCHHSLFHSVLIPLLYLIPGYKRFLVFLHPSCICSHYSLLNVASNSNWRRTLLIS
jgi:hypothetical protein